MIIVGHLILFFLAGMVNVGILTRLLIAYVMFFVVLISGIYFLGWWAILTFIVGALCGAYMHFSAEKLKQEDISTAFTQPLESSTEEENNAK
jgi:hypothetical protein